MDDGFLIRQVLGGHHDAFRLLVVRYQRPLFGFLGGFGLEQAAAEELAQETFLRAFRNLAEYDANKAGFSSWLYTIAKHLAMNETASRRHRAPHVEAGELDLQNGAPLAPEALQAQESRDRVRAALRGLPEALRSTLALTVPSGQVFVLGDKRSPSQDSRHFGTLPLADVAGIARLIW